MIWKPSQVLEGGIPPCSCSHEETDPSLPSCLNATGNDWPWLHTHPPCRDCDNMALRGAVSQTNVTIRFKRERRRKSGCVIRIGNISNDFHGKFPQAAALAQLSR